MLLILRSARAARDLDEMWDYIPDIAGVARADIFLERLGKRMNMLAEFPDMGYRCEELAPGLRGLTLSDYIVFYRRRENIIEIARVLHGARDTQSLFKDGE